MVKKANVSPSHPRRAKTRLFHGFGRSESSIHSLCALRFTLHDSRFTGFKSDARTKLADFFNILR